MVVDECLSIQNDSALQTAEAWRQVAASRAGCLLLSATFFRSRYSKLFYMIRMLRSPLPRTEPHLPALLREHIVCFVPETRRVWSLKFRPVKLPIEAGAAYDSRLEQFAAMRSGGRNAFGNARALWSELKGFLRDHYEQALPAATIHSPLIASFVSESERLISTGRRPLLFANTENELERILVAIPGARRWGGGRGISGDSVDAHAIGGATQVTTGSKRGPLVVTVREGAHGLNCQRDADAIVCRPQPGDVIEQMKGRIDRPGQPRDRLELVVLFAASTVRMCNSCMKVIVCDTLASFSSPLSSK